MSIKIGGNRFYMYSWICTKHVSKFSLTPLYKNKVIQFGIEFSVMIVTKFVVVSDFTFNFTCTNYVTSTLHELISKITQLHTDT